MVRDRLLQEGDEMRDVYRLGVATVSGGTSRTRVCRVWKGDGEGCCSASQGGR